MAISKLPPNTILLGGGLPGGDGGHTVVEEYIAGVEIIPGMVIELFNDTGLKWRPHNAAADMQAVTVAIEKSIWNKDVDSPYAIGDMVRAVTLRKGSSFWGLVPSGQNITQGDKLQSNGDGRLKEATATTAAANVAVLQALETIGAVTAVTRLRTQVVA